MKIAYANETMHTCDDENSDLHYDKVMVPSFCPIIEMHISCQNLVNLDIGSKSDPVCVLLTMQNGKFVEAARTEIIKNNLNPQFVTTFKTYFIFDFHQPLRFEVYDSDFDSYSLQDYDFIGYYETDVQHIVSNLGQSITFELRNDKKKGERGQLIITSDQTKESTINLKGQIQVNELKKMKTFAKNNPFFEISRLNKNGSIIPIYRSKAKKKCFSCAFKTFLIPLYFLYTDGLDDTIIISFYDLRMKKEPKLIGEYRSSVGYLTQSIRTHFPIRNSSKKTVGEFWFNQCEIVHVPTFANYLKSGIRLKTITAINLTYSNGPQTSSNSLHYIHSDPNWLNQYQKAILNVGSILAKYNNDQKFPAFGFGAKFDGKVHHCFPLTFNPNDPNVNGIQGILDAYKNCIQKVDLKYPSYFAEIIKTATKMAIQNWNKSHIYSVLLIISDGGVEDMKETKNAIVEASDAPLSIIIIGVGNWSFKDFEVLDSDDDYLYSSTGERMKRDIVQFVSFKKIDYCSTSKMESEVLEELPLQLHEYCSDHGYFPPIES